jgi:hypothetical protein
MKILGRYDTQFWVLLLLGDSSELLSTEMKTQFRKCTLLQGAEISASNGEIRNLVSFNVFMAFKRAGIVTDYGLNGRGAGVRVPVGARIFFSQLRPHQFWGPPSLLSNEYREALSPWVKRPGREADHLPPASAEVRNTWIHCYTSHPHVPSYCTYHCFWIKCRATHRHSKPHWGAACTTLARLQPWLSSSSCQGLVSFIDSHLPPKSIVSSKFVLGFLSPVVQHFVVNLANLSFCIMLRWQATFL